MQEVTHPAPVSIDAEVEKTEPTPLLSDVGRATGLGAAIGVRQFSNDFWGYRSIVFAADRDGKAIAVSGWAKGYASRDRAIEEARKEYGDEKGVLAVVTL